MEVVTIFEFLAPSGDVDFFLWFGEVRSTENAIEETTVSRSQVPPASQDNHLICIQEVLY